MMNSSNSYYWRIVNDCLVEIHGLDAVEARRRIREFRVRLRTAPQSIDTDLIFHDEPFTLGCRLAEKEQLAPTTKEAQAYRQILRRRAEEAEALGTEEEARRLHEAAGQGVDQPPEKPPQGNKVDAGLS
jgi:hypothetical protein